MAEARLVMRILDAFPPGMSVFGYPFVDDPVYRTTRYARGEPAGVLLGAGLEILRPGVSPDPPHRFLEDARRLQRRRLAGDAQQGEQELQGGRRPPGVPEEIREVLGEVIEVSPQELVGPLAIQHHLGWTGNVQRIQPGREREADP